MDVIGQILGVDYAAIAKRYARLLVEKRDIAVEFEVLLCYFGCMFYVFFANFFADKVRFDDFI